MPSWSLVADSLAVYALLGAPWLGRMWYQRARRRVASGAADAKLRMYREIVAEQAVTTSVVLALWKFGGVTAQSLGLLAPRSWAWNAWLLLAFIVLLAWAGSRLRPKADEIRKKVEGSVGALLPRSRAERFWFGMVSVGAGISEELVFRGFLFYYFTVHVSGLNSSEKALLCGLFFGLAHIYQGWKGAVSAGILGLILSALYLLTGSLLAPIVVHAVVDLRALLIFPPEEHSPPEPVLV